MTINKEINIGQFHKYFILGSLFQYTIHSVTRKAQSYISLFAGKTNRRTMKEVYLKTVTKKRSSLILKRTHKLFFSRVLVYVDNRL